MKKTLALAGALLLSWGLFAIAQNVTVIGGSLEPSGSIGTPTATATTDLNQSGGTTLLAFASTTGIATGQVVAGTSITDGTTVSSIVATAQTTLPANGSFVSGQKVIPMAVTATFAAGQQCHDNTGATSIGDGNVIASIQANVSITLTSNVAVNSSGAVDSITCDPVVTLSAVSTGTISSGASIKFYANATAATTAGSGVLAVNGGMAVLGKQFNANTLSVAGHVTFEGVTSTGAQGSGAMVFATTPTLTTPVLGVATGTSAALGGCTIGTDALCLTGTSTVSGAITSTVTTGTAPFVVASTTNVANLNAATLNGTTFAAPAAIGSGTPAAGSFTTVGATGLISPASAIGIKGTITNDNAQAASIGQIIEANCPVATSGASVLFSNASPTVGTWAGLPWSGTGTYACPMNITATAPTGLSTATNYWIAPIDATTFHVATTAANAIAGTFANTSGSTTTTNMTTNAILTTTNTFNLGSVALTAGDWECYDYTIYIDGTTTSITNLAQGITQTSATLGVLGTYSDLETAANVMTATNNPVLTVPAVRELLSGTTNVYSVTVSTFTASTLNASSDLRCRRAR